MRLLHFYYNFALKHLCSLPISVDNTESLTVTCLPKSSINLHTTSSIQAQQSACVITGTLPQIHAFEVCRMETRITENSSKNNNSDVV